MITAVLAGNPNCGKTTLFNRLTNSRYKVGNRSGVTVAPKMGRWNGNILVDLPGIYSLENSNAEETAAEKYIKENEISQIINIIDASNLERSLRLTFQLARLGMPMIVVLNMADKIKESGYEIDSKGLSEKIGCPVVRVCAARGEGIKELCAAEAKAPCFEASEKWIEETSKNVLIKRGKNIILERSMRADRVLLGNFRFLILLLVMGAVFWLTFGMPGSFVSQKLMTVYGRFGAFAEHILDMCGVNEFLKRLICDGILCAVGSIVPFFGQILILFFCLSMLEDVGYMSRIIFIAEQAMERLGLCGRSIVTIITGFGCTVPAAMTLKNISDEGKRKRTANILPFVSCSAKMPVYIVFASAFFNNTAPVVICGIYIFGLLGAFFYAMLSKEKQREEVFVLELPPYRCPTLKNTINELAEKLGDFASRAGSILFLAGIAVWFLESVDFSLKLTEIPSESILGTIGKFAAPVFIPCGFGNWQSAVALISGLAAKEAIISTFSVVCGGASFAENFSAASCCSFLVFVLFYAPCAAALSALGEELSEKEIAALALRQFLIAWCASVIVYIVAGVVFAL